MFARLHISLDRIDFTFNVKGLAYLNNSYNLEIFVYKTWRPKFFIQFEIIVNVLDSSFGFIWIPMLWVYATLRPI